MLKMSLKFVTGNDNVLGLRLQTPSLVQF